MTQIRIKLSRNAGWRIPINTLKVARPGKWGNPFSVADYGRAEAIRRYRIWLEQQTATGKLNISELTGKHLACWCRLDEPCHADVLLDLANGARL